MCGHCILKGNRCTRTDADAAKRLVRDLIDRTYIEGSELLRGSLAIQKVLVYTVRVETQSIRAYSGVGKYFKYVVIHHINVYSDRTPTTL